MTQPPSGADASPATVPCFFGVIGNPTATVADAASIFRDPNRRRSCGSLLLRPATDRLAVMTAPLESAVGAMAGLHLASVAAPPVPACGFSLSAHLARDIAALPDIVDGLQTVPDTPGLGTDPSEFWRET